MNKLENTDSLQLTEQKYKEQYNSIKRSELFLWMASAPENVLCEIMKRINPAPYKKIMGTEKARLYALLVSAEEVRAALKLTGRKNPEHDLGKLEATHRLNLALASRPKRRQSEKREKIALHEGVIRQLLAHGFSLRQVAEYLRREAKFKVTHTYLRQCCLEMGIDFPRKIGRKS